MRTLAVGSLSITVIMASIFSKGLVHAVVLWRLSPQPGHWSASDCTLLSPHLISLQDVEPPALSFVIGSLNIVAVRSTDICSPCLGLSQRRLYEHILFPACAVWHVNFDTDLFFTVLVFIWIFWVIWNPDNKHRANITITVPHHHSAPSHGTVCETAFELIRLLHSMEVVGLLSSGPDNLQSGGPASICAVQCLKGQFHAWGACRIA